MKRSRPTDLKLFGGVLLAAFMVMPPTTQAADLLSDERARVAGIAILKGDPYGKTAMDVALNIQSSRLIMSGNTKCGGGKTTSPAWEFHVVVPPSRNPNSTTTINGYLLLDARSGKLKCAGLPFLD